MENHEMQVIKKNKQQSKFSSAHKSIGIHNKVPQIKMIPFKIKDLNEKNSFNNFENQNSPFSKASKSINRFINNDTISSELTKTASYSPKNKILYSVNDASDTNSLGKKILSGVPIKYFSSKEISNQAKPRKNVELPSLYTPEKREMVLINGCFSGRDTKNKPHKKVQASTLSKVAKNTFTTISPVLNPVGLKFDVCRSEEKEKSPTLASKESSKEEKTSITQLQNSNESPLPSKIVQVKRRLSTIEKIDIEIRPLQKEDESIGEAYHSHHQPIKKRLTLPENTIVPVNSFNKSNSLKKQSSLSNEKVSEFSVGDDIKSGRIVVETKKDSEDKLIKSFFSKTQAGKNEDGSLKINQDSCLICTSIFMLKEFNIFGVLDGHGNNGHFASNFVVTSMCDYFSNKDHFIKSKKKVNEITEYYIYEKLKNNNYQMITTAFNKAETELSLAKFDVNFSGTTCVLIIQTSSKIICANTGDSRAIMVSEAKMKKDSYEVEALSNDHKPENEIERKRIESLDGVIDQYCEDGIKAGPQRVWLKNENYPGLAMSRSIGDLVATSVGVITTPDMIEHEINEYSRYVIIASDGVWEFLDNQKVMAIVNPFYAKNNPEGACNAIIAEATQLWEKEDNVIDDITAIAIFF